MPGQIKLNFFKLIWNDKEWNQHPPSVHRRSSSQIHQVLPKYSQGQGGPVEVNARMMFWDSTNFMINWQILIIVNFGYSSSLRLFRIEIIGNFSLTRKRPIVHLLITTYFLFVHLIDYRLNSLLHVLKFKLWEIYCCQAQICEGLFCVINEDF